ncbi:hypothetical protein BDN72DRAFT_223542 [Pluteus cervinus]|uniref:Uncharacterized protein n=1 Tax=Pluteus cervinus TaxID=181527 RepID=A0ACD3BE97_9AGAR|nr:hypothetical protein BDN72DRAFT_223542 [Pluteus cervinus]
MQYYPKLTTFVSANGSWLVISQTSLISDLYHSSQFSPVAIHTQNKLNKIDAILWGLGGVAVSFPSGSNALQGCKWLTTLTPTLVHRAVHRCLIHYVCVLSL